MRKTGAERNIIVLAIFIVLAVGVSGYLVHKSMTQIVNSIHEEVGTNRELILIKNISLDLLELENSVRLFALTKDESNLENYSRIKNRLNQRITYFSERRDSDLHLIDSIQILVNTKQGIWEEIKNINTAKKIRKPQYDELYSMLGKVEIDTITVEVVVPPESPKGFFRKVFGKKDSASIRIDTSYVERTVENKEIEEEIRELEELESGLEREEQKRNERELELIQENIRITGKLNKLIAQIEKAERDGLIAKNEEADRLATLIYRRLSSFSIMAVTLLFVVLYFFIRYLWKTKKVEKTLRLAKQNAENLAKAKEVFMANVSHEMRTPVNAIFGLSEQLLHEHTDRKVNKKLSVLHKSSRHLKDVVNDTLDFSKIQANKLKLTKLDFTPEQLIQEVFTILEPEAKDKNIQLIFKCKKTLPEAIKGDPFRLKQILLNTIGNAIKFTEKGSVTLNVELRQVDHKLLHVGFQIADTGIGISEKNLDLIFDDFVQIETDYTRRYSGTGLGLSIVKRLIELQKGEISIHSKLQKGTVVSFYIPYKIGNPKSLENQMNLDIAIPESVKGIKILIVDDEEYNRFLLKTIFSKWGLTNYFEAKDGKEAVNMAAKHSVDIVLMDLRMPKLNGFEASKRILKEKSDIKIIALATINNEDEMKMCIDAGMALSLSKPFSEKELLNTIVGVENIVDEEKSKRSGIDLKDLERLANGDLVFMKEMIGIFIRSANDGVLTIKEALKNDEWQVISEAAHKMAAPCKHIGANDLYADLKQLEDQTGKEEKLEQIPVLVVNVEQKVEQIIRSLSKLMDSE